MAAGSQPVLTVRGAAKTFGGRNVLAGLDLELAGGRVRGLIGQNGSGKSTLIKILSGYHAPDPGAELTVRGEPVALPLAATQARSLGLSFVHQDLGLVENATVVENLRLGRYETGRLWRISWRRERRVVDEALREFGLEFAASTRVADLREVDRAMIAVVRSLQEMPVGRPGVLVLDEPTAYLPRDGVDRLFAAVREVAARGHAVLFVTHRLDEVMALTDSVTILRDGRLIETAETKDVTEKELVSRILGFELGELYPTPHHSQADLVFAVDELAGGLALDFSLDLHRGEVVGLTGLIGAGWEEIPYLLFGARPARHGTVAVEGNSLDAVTLNPKQMKRAGVALLPANRLRDGAVPDAPVTENMTLPTIGDYFLRGFLNRRAERRDVAAALEEFDVRPRDPAMPLRRLSGGNQQKVVLAKWFRTQPRVFLMHEPTQGVDVGTRKQIFAQLRDAAERGTALLLASSEYDDLAHLCDRVVVFRHGRPAATLHGEQLTYERIVEQCFLNEQESV